MALTPERKSHAEEKLDKCDKALADYPTLASIYNDAWRTEFRESLLNANSEEDQAYPAAYGSPIFTFLPPDFQKRIEDGARILLSKLDKKDRNHLIKRFRNSGVASAEEECLLALGFTAEFGEDAILSPQAPLGSRKPEFSVCVESCEICIEAKGLFPSDLERSLWKAARRKGQHGWVTRSRKREDIDRVRSAVAKKLCEATPGKPTILVLTKYSTPFPPASEIIDPLREITAYPAEYQIPCSNYPLAMAFVSEWQVRGVWFNASVLGRLNMDKTMTEKIRKAVRQSFYPWPDDIFFNETLDEESHQKMLGRMGG